MKKILNILFLFMSGIVLSQSIESYEYNRIPYSGATQSVNLGANSFSVGGISTLTGAAKLTNTLNYVGNTTLSSDATVTLTTGNTGIIAVLSDAVFPVTFNFASSSLADATTYYFGTVQSPLNTTSTISKNTLPYNCTLVAWDFTSFYLAGSAETMTLAIAGSTNYTLTNSVATNVGGAATLNGSGLSQSFNASDAINAKLVCPTWVTNPTGVYGTLTLWFVRRQ